MTVITPHSERLDRIREDERALIACRTEAAVKTIRSATDGSPVRFHEVCFEHESCWTGWDHAVLNRLAEIQDQIAELHLRAAIVKRMSAVTRKDGMPRTTPDLSALYRAEVAEMDNEQTDAEWIGYTERNDAA